jgi:hypothetical protein
MMTISFNGQETSFNNMSNKFPLDTITSIRFMELDNTNMMIQEVFALRSPCLQEENKIFKMKNNYKQISLN